MKATVIEAHGGPEVLRPTDLPEPRLGAREALVRVRACALNHLDLWVRGGLPHIRPRFPHVLGSDIAGEIAAVGPEVLGFKAGDRVMLQPGVSCGVCADCLAGDDHFCRRYEIFGARRPGGYAEYVAAPEANLIPMPPELDFPEAAAIPLVFLTAWHMLVSRAGLRARETVLVQAAGSGVGSAAVQIAKLLGARVIATAGSEAKLAKARELGADELVDYSRADFGAEVRRLTDGRGADVVFEHVGEKVWDASLHALARGGRLVTCGATTGFHGPTNLNVLFGRHLSVLGSFMGRKSELLEAMKFVRSGHLHAVVDRVMPLSEAAEAHRRVARREQFGKVVLEV